VQISGDLLSNAGQCSSGARRRLCWAHAQSASCSWYDPKRSAANSAPWE
jgi:hypothetical protein